MSKKELNKEYPVQDRGNCGWMLTGADDESLDTLIALRKSSGIPLTLLLAKAIAIGARELTSTLG